MLQYYLRVTLSCPKSENIDWGVDDGAASAAERERERRAAASLCYGIVIATISMSNKMRAVLIKGGKSDSAQDLYLGEADRPTLKEGDGRIIVKVGRSCVRCRRFGKLTESYSCRSRRSA